MNTLDALDAQTLRTDLPGFRAGDTLKVHVKVVEGNRSRIQVFQGVVIRGHGGGCGRPSPSARSRFGVGVERTFPVHSPIIDRIEVVTRGDVRRAKLYYLRDLRGQDRQDQGEAREGSRQLTLTWQCQGVLSTTYTADRRLAAGLDRTAWVILRMRRRSFLRVRC